MDEDGDPEFTAVVFPPSKHENLHLLPLPTPYLSPQSSSSTSNFSSSSSYSSPSSSSSESFSSSDADEVEGDDPRPYERSPLDVDGHGSAGAGWLLITIGMIRSKVLGKVRFRGGSSDGERGRVFWSMGALAAVVAWVWWMYMRIRFRRRWRRLVRGIRERDEGGKSTLVNCQVLQATVNRSKGNQMEISRADLVRKSSYCRVSGRDMDLLELSACGNVRRSEDPGGCRIQ